MKRSNIKSRLRRFSKLWGIVPLNPGLSERRLERGEKSSVKEVRRDKINLIKINKKVIQTLKIA